LLPGTRARGTYDAVGVEVIVVTQLVEHGVDHDVLDELRRERRGRGWHHGPFRSVRGVAGADQAGSCTIPAAGTGMSDRK
jgi:hypothetical protein